MKILSQMQTRFNRFDERKIREFFKPVLILFVIYSIFASAIFRANFNYIDDMGRANTGYTGWETMSRYVSVYLSYLIHTDTFLSDISPLTQYIALFFIAIASVSLIYLYQGHTNVTLIQYIAAIPLALSPYFLECLSYKYDAPYMALSILASIVPLLVRNKHMLLYFIISTVGMLVVCMTYQAASGLYPILVVILATRDWSQRHSWKRILAFIGVSVLSYGAAMLIFKFAIMKSVDMYVSGAMYSLPELLPGFMTNLKRYYSCVRNDYKPEWLIFSGVCVAAYLWAFIRDAKQHKIIAAFVGAISLMLISILVFGLYPALVKTSFVPREMYGFGVTVGMLGMSVSTGKKLLIGKAACVALSWCFIVLSFSYGNALAAQAEYTHYRAQMIAESIGELGYYDNDQPYYFKVKGNIGYAASVPEDAIIKRLVPVPLKESWYWGSYGLAYYYGLDNVRLYYPTTAEIEMVDPVRKVDNAMYSIDVSGQNVLITLK